VLEAVLGQRPSKELTRLVAAWSDGNPYFVEELVTWLVDREVMTREGEDWRLAGDPGQIRPPVGVEGLIQGRIDDLSGEVKELLRAAAVFGESFWEGACEALGCAEVRDRLAMLRSQEFVVPARSSRVSGEREWEFRHALVRQVAYGQLPPERLQLHHRAAASWLERVGERDAALLAHHYRQGGDELRAAEHYARAGEKALTDGDLGGAVSFFESSLSLDEAEQTEPQRAERLMGLARSQILMGRYDRAWKSLERVPALATEEAGGQLQLLRGRILHGQGRYPEAEAILARAARSLAGLDAGELLFQVRHTLFWVVWAQGRYSETAPIAEQLRRQATESGYPEQLCLAKLALSSCSKVEGDLLAAIELVDGAVTHAREAGHPYREVDGLIMLADAQEQLGLYERAQETLQAAWQLALRLETVFHKAGIQALLGRVRCGRGEIDRAIEHFQAACREARAIGDDRTLAMALAGLARCQEGAQALETAREVVELAADRAPPAEAMARMVLAEVLLAGGHPAEATEEALKAVELMDRLGAQERFEIEILLVARDALQAEGRAAESAELLDRARCALRTRAGRIEDPKVRESYTKRVAAHARVGNPWGE
jgi:tetratricopeptide (TPR) repeat protein